MQMKIYLFRHGEKQLVKSTDLEAKRSVKLTSKGIGQTKKLAGELKTKFKELTNVQEIFTSPLPRAIQSAEIVKNILGISKVIIEGSLAEYYMHNDYTLDKKIRDELKQKSLENFDFVSPETRESINMLQEKTLRFFNKEKQSGKKLILCSTHGMLIRSLVYKINPSLKPETNQLATSPITEGGLTILELKDKLSVKLFDYVD